jgi:opacity protein-like surface antigen
MKKLLGFVLTLLSFALKSQSPVQITLMTFESYSFADKIVTEDGYEGKINDGFQWGGGLEFCFREKVALELIYQRLNTDGYLDKPLAYVSGTNIVNTTERTQGNIAIDYYLLGGTRYHPLTDKVSGFGTINAGLGVLSSTDNNNSSNAEKFCWGLRLGLKIQANEKVSIRLHGQLLSAVQAVGGGLYFGTGGGGAGVTGYSTFWQFNLGGSVNFRLK